MTLEKSFERFDALPALLVLVPAHLSSSGALGGILSGRLSSKLFLGLVPPASRPNREARRDISLVFLLATPVYLVNGIGAHAVARLLGQASPGLAQMVAVSLIGGALAIVFVVAVAYYGTVAAYRTGVDPDTYGIPVVSSSVDLVGAFTLIIGIALLGLIRLSSTAACPGDPSVPTWTSPPSTAAPRPASSSPPGAEDLGCGRSCSHVAPASPARPDLATTKGPRRRRSVLGASGVPGNDPYCMRSPGRAGRHIHVPSIGPCVHPSLDSRRHTSRRCRHGSGSLSMSTRSRPPPILWRFHVIQTPNLRPLAEAKDLSD